EIFWLKLSTSTPANTPLHSFCSAEVSRVSELLSRLPRFGWLSVGLLRSLGWSQKGWLLMLLLGGGGLRETDDAHPAATKKKNTESPRKTMRTVEPSTDGTLVFRPSSTHKTGHARASLSVRGQDGSFGEQANEDAISPPNLAPVAVILRPDRVPPSGCAILPSESVSVKRN